MKSASFEDESAINENPASESSEMVENAQSDWLKLATAIDRIAFLSYVIIFSIYAIFSFF